MNTFTYLIIYFVLCAGIAFFVPIAKNKWKKYLKDFNRAFRRNDYQENQVILSLRTGLVKILMIITFVILTLLFLIFTPFIALFLVIYYNKKNSKWEYYRKMCPANDEGFSNIHEYEKEDTETNLYFWEMGGAGNIRCCNCGYSEEITSFVHGFESGRPAGVEGLQCQSCGKFHSLNFEEKRSNRKCNCGGKLERDKPVFCPQCKSKNVKYSMSIIT